MAKNSANEAALGDLHAKVAGVFTKILDVYSERLENTVVDADGDPLPQEDPNPAMMGAITKFLKDNAIAFDAEEVAELSDTEQRLAQRRKHRANLINLTNLKVVDNDG